MCDRSQRRKRQRSRTERKVKSKMPPTKISERRLPSRVQLKNSKKQNHFKQARGVNYMNTAPERVYKAKRGFFGKRNLKRGNSAEKGMQAFVREQIEIPRTERPKPEFACSTRRMSE